MLLRKEEIWVSKMRDLAHFLDDHHGVEGRRQGLTDSQCMIGGTPEYYVDILRAGETIKLMEMAGDVVAEMRRIRLDSEPSDSPVGKVYTALDELSKQAIRFKRNHDTSIACAKRLGQSPTYGRLILPKRVEEYKSLLSSICSTCGGIGAVFIQHRTGLDDPKMEYVREPCPGPSSSSAGTPCPHGAMENRRVGETSFAANPNIVIDDAYIHATLADLRRVSLPLLISPALAGATPEQQRNFEVYGNGIHWPDLDDDIMAESFGGAPSSVFPDTAIGTLIESAKAVLETADESVREGCGPLLRRVCDCNCHRFVCAIPTSVPCGDGRECIGTPTDPCMKCGQRRGSA